MATQAINTIMAKLTGSPVKLEKLATAVAITPGMLCEGTAGADTVQANSASGADCERMFAIEDENQGGKISTAYTASTRINLWIPRSGDEVYALLANGQNAALNAKLVSNGDGQFKVMVADSSGTLDEEIPIAIATEAVDMSTSSAADPNGRIKVRII